MRSRALPAWNHRFKIFHNTCQLIARKNAGRKVSIISRRNGKFGVVRGIAIQLKIFGKAFCEIKPPFLIFTLFIGPLFNPFLNDQFRQHWSIDSLFYEKPVQCLKGFGFFFILTSAGPLFCNKSTYLTCQSASVLVSSAHKRSPSSNDRAHSRRFSISRRM